MLSKEAIMFYAEHPVEFVEDVIHAKPDNIQAEILNSLVNNSMTTVRSGHGTGKSTVESWAIIWFMCTRPYPKIPCTAPTQHQLFDILWAEVSKWTRNNPLISSELIWTTGKLYLRGHPEEWFAVPRTATKPDALQGFHAENMLYIIDEASGVEDKVFEPVLGALSTPGAKLLMCGNPTQLSGFFYESHHKNRGAYNAFHIDGRNSSRVSKEFIQTIIDMYGEDSDVFRVRVAGEFPSTENDVFIPLPLVEAATMNEIILDKRVTSITLGVDIARFGDDETVICQNIDGKITVPLRRNGQDTMKTAGDIIQICNSLIKQYPLYKGQIMVNVDDTGVGGGVTDRLKEVKRLGELSRVTIVPINFAEKIPDEEAAVYYADLPTYMYSVLREMLKEKQISLPDNADMVAQLSTRKYFMTSIGKIALESKKDMKKRGLKSPDLGDAVALSVYRKKLFSLKNLV